LHAHLITFQNMVISLSRHDFPRHLGNRFAYKNSIKTGKCDSENADSRPRGR
jgi:hypothetical protein